MFQQPTNRSYENFSWSTHFQDHLTCLLRSFYLLQIYSSNLIYNMEKMINKLLLNDSRYSGIVARYFEVGNSPNRFACCLLRFESINHYFRHQQSRFPAACFWLLSTIQSLRARIGSSYGRGRCGFKKCIEQVEVYWRQRNKQKRSKGKNVHTPTQNTTKSFRNNTEFIESVWKSLI